MRRFSPLGLVLAVALCVGIVSGLAAEASLPNIGRTVIATDRLYYAAGARGGLYASTDGGVTWVDRSDGLPVKVVYPFLDSEPRRVTSISYDPTQPSRIAITTATKVYVSQNSGDGWEEVALSSPIRPADYLTTVALSPHSADTMYVGTSFNGYYVTTNGGRTWGSGKSSLGALYKGAAFYEEVSSIAVSPLDANHIFLLSGFGGGLYESHDRGSSFTELPTPAEFIREQTTAGDAHLSFVEVPEGGWNLSLSTGSGGGWSLDSTAEPTWSAGVPRLVVSDRESGAGRAAALRRRIAGQRTGIYVNASWAAGDDLALHMEMLKKHGMDTIVVDMKDDAGRLSYDTGLELPREMGAVYERFNLRELLVAAHGAGIYVVGRVVVFQDPKLYRYNNSENAIWDKAKNKAWANMIRVRGAEGEEDTFQQREFWVDPFSEFAWNYNVSIANELQLRGVDEIQFDYIRFPSDGDLTHAQYRHRKQGMNRVDAIESFLRVARTKVTIPISTDLYGFNSWYRMGNWIGQNIDIVADYVDVISPMFYPSHFPTSFMNKLEFFDRARYIYQVGSDRAAAITAGRSVIRPYVQAFLIGSERAFEEPEYTEYLASQLEGVSVSKASGFTLWNASNIYYMVVHSLAEYTGKEER